MSKKTPRKRPDLMVWSAFGLAILLFAHPAQAAECPNYKTAPTVSLKTNPGKMVLKRGHGRDDLIRMQAANNAAPPQKGAYPMGLTLTDFRYSIETGVKIRQLAANKYCAYPASFALNVSFSNFLVYIDRRYKRGSCEYEAINRHEYTHVVLYRKQLERALPNLRHQARTAAKRIKPILVRSPDAGVKKIQAAMQSRMKPFIDKLSRDTDKVNARIDTPASYLKIQKKCRNW